MAGDVTIDDILDELTGYMDCEMRQEGDIDARQIAERSGLSQRQGLNRLMRIAQDHPDKFEKVKVYDAECRARLWVLRKL